MVSSSLTESIETKDCSSTEILQPALKSTRLFPRVFLHTTEVAEESGQLPEVMRRQCVNYQDEVGRRLRTLTQMAAWGVWLMYAIFAIVMIFKLASLYLGALEV